MTAVAYALDPRLRDRRHCDARAALDLADWLAWLELSNAAARTLDTYERYCAALLRDWRDVGFAEFDDGHLLHSIKKFTPKSRHLVKAAWNNWFRWGYKVARRIPGNPVDLLPSIKYKPNRAYDIFTPAEADALCALPTPDGELMTLLFWTGIRRGEALGLTGKRVDFGNRQLIVIEGAKGDKPRKVDLIQRAFVACDQLLTLEGIGRDDHVWATRPGGGKWRREAAMSNTSFDNWWARSLEAASVRHRVPHTTRHTFATRLFELGMKNKEVQLLLGHESSATTEDTYIHVSQFDLGSRLREVVGDPA